ncbi:unnamed protein product [Chrysoparadoxa australica]
MRLAQLRCVPLAMLRADAVLVLPVPRGRSEFRQTVLSEALGSGWIQMELALAQLGQAKTFIHYHFAGNDIFVQISWGPHALAEASESASRTLLETREYSQEDQVFLKIVQDSFCLGDDKSMPEPAELLQAAFDDVSTLEAAVADGQEDAKTALTAIRSMDISDESIGGKLKAWKALGALSFEEDRRFVAGFLLGSVAAAKHKAQGDYTSAFAVTAPMEVSYKTVGVVESPYKERFGTPRQPTVTNGVLSGKELNGVIRLFKGQGYEAGLQDLESYDYVWVLTHMHLNGSGWNALVRPPRLKSGDKKGLFSTRSPHRPNPIALSALQVTGVDVEEGTISVLGLDVLDGTPVLDIKPYIPYCDSFPDAHAGWVDSLVEDEAKADHARQPDSLSSFSVGAALVSSVREEEQDEAGDSAVTSDIWKETSGEG